MFFWSSFQAAASKSLSRCTLSSRSSRISVVTLFVIANRPHPPVFCQTLDHNHPTSPLLAKPPELSEEVKLPASMKFVAANTVGE